MPTVQAIADAIADALVGGVGVVGESDLEITGLGSIETARHGQITHLSGSTYRRFLATTEASAVLLREADAAQCPSTALVVDNPYLAFALVSQIFNDAPRLPAGVHPAAHIADSAEIHPTAAIAANATLCANVQIGAGVEIGPGAYLGTGVVVGDDSLIHSNATLYHGVRLGCRCVIHSGAVLGADGFGFTPDSQGRLQAIAQLGGVVLGDDVSVGACSSIDRGTITDTIIRDGVKIDNQVQIGHNCDIGEHTLICGCAGIVGSTKIGRHCMFAGGSAVAGAHPIEICDFVQVGVVTTITRSITEPGVYMGSVLHNTAQRWRRNAVRFGQLDEMAKQLARLAAAYEEQNQSGGESTPS